MIDYQNNSCVIKQKQKYLADGIRLEVQAPTHNTEALLEITIAGEEFSEKHFLYEGKTVFDLSEYFLETLRAEYQRLLYVPSEQNISLPFAVFNGRQQLVLTRGLATSLSITIDDTEHELDVNDLEVIYGYSKFERSERLHLFNPHYEAIAEYIPTLEGEATEWQTVFGLCFNRNNGNTPVWYSNDTEEVRYAVRQVRLNDYWDERYNSEGITLDFLQNENGSEGTTYLIDTRTKGAYVRFLDSNGFMQQLLLDIESCENAYEDGELLVGYKMGTRHYEDYSGMKIMQGHQQTARRVHTQSLHCSVTNLPKGLISDLKALALSPITLLYRGKDEDGIDMWENVRVVPTESIVDDKKKAQISAKFDIYPIFENTL